MNSGFILLRELKASKASKNHDLQIFRVCIQGIKGTLMQIWKSANIFVIIWKWYVKDLHLLFANIQKQ